jgi:undecaprenyl-diphosphatase
MPKPAWVGPRRLRARARRSRHDDGTAACRACNRLEFLIRRDYLPNRAYAQRIVPFARIHARISQSARFPWLALLLVVAAAGLWFGVLTHDVARGATVRWDAPIQRLLHERSGSVAVDDAMKGLLFLGGEYSDPPPWILIGLALAACLATGRRKGALLLVLSLAGAAVLARLLQPQFERAPLRADYIHTFPSGHALGSAVIVGALVVGFWTSRYRVPIAVIGSVFLVVYGAALVYLRRHYPSDVVAGWCLALMVVAVFATAIRAAGSVRARLDSTRAVPDR